MLLRNETPARLVSCMTVAWWFPSAVFAGVSAADLVWNSQPPRRDPMNTWQMGMSRIRMPGFRFIYFKAAAAAAVAFWSVGASSGCGISPANGAYSERSGHTKAYLVDGW
jgi:hypothetical protein